MLAGDLYSLYSLIHLCCHVTAELRNALPAMVVEILQEKLDRKIIDDISHLPEMITEPSDGLTSSVSANYGPENTTSARCDDGLNEFPKNWEPMDSSEVFWLIVIMLVLSSDLRSFEI